jgi:hypothetical protein
VDINFGIQSYAHRSLPLSAQRMVNCYLEKAPDGAKSPYAVVPSFGITAGLAVGGGPFRGSCVANQVLYVVSGSKLFRVTSSTSLPVELGAIPGLGRVVVITDGTNVLVLSDGKGYLWNGFTLSQVADTDFPTTSRGTFIDGYALVIEQGTGRFWINETIGDWSTWNGLDFATAEGWPDDTIDTLTDHREAFLFGKETTETWANVGNADFPLQRVASGFIEKGILSAGAATKLDNTVFFVGHDGIVYRLDGYTPIRISQHAVEQSIEGYADKSCAAFPFIESGHAFVAFKFATGTWVFDIATGFWHERESNRSDTWRPLNIHRCFDKWLVIDEQSNQLGYLAEDTFTEYGDILRCSATAPSISKDNRWVFHGRLELIFEQGVGTVTGQGVDPQVMLDWSDDGGRTWSNENWRNIGRVGQFRRRTFLSRLGRSRDRVYRYAISDPVRRTLVQATLEAEVGEY